MILLDTNVVSEEILPEPDDPRYTMTMEAERLAAHDPAGSVAEFR